MLIIIKRYYMITKKEIGEIIQNQRRQKGITQDELAEKIDISTNYLSKVERGLSILNTESFLKMADVLDFTLENFGIKIKTENYNTEQQEIIKKILSASPEKLKLYLETIKFLDNNIFNKKL